MEGIGQLQVFLAKPETLKTKQNKTKIIFKNEQKSKKKKKKKLKRFFLLSSVLFTPGSQLSDSRSAFVCSDLLRQVSHIQAGLELHTADNDYKLLTLLPPPASYSTGS